MKGVTIIHGSGAYNKCGTNGTARQWLRIWQSFDFNLPTMKQIIRQAVWGAFVLCVSFSTVNAADQNPIFGSESLGEFEVTITDQPLDPMATTTANLAPCTKQACPNAEKTGMQPAADVQQP
jgi:hypothetical protein